MRKGREKKKTKWKDSNEEKREKEEESGGVRREIRRGSGRYE